MATGGSKCNSSASRRFSRASSSVRPWLATSTSRHWETNQSPSRQTVAENGRFIKQSWHNRRRRDVVPGHFRASRYAATRALVGTDPAQRHSSPCRLPDRVQWHLLTFSFSWHLGLDIPPSVGTARSETEFDAQQVSIELIWSNAE